MDVRDFVIPSGLEDAVRIYFKRAAYFFAVAKMRVRLILSGRSVELRDALLVPDHASLAGLSQDLRRAG